MALTANDLADLQNSVRGKFRKNKITDLAQLYQANNLCKLFAFEKQVDGQEPISKVIVDSGDQYEFVVSKARVSSAHWTGPYRVQTRNVENTTTTGNIPWRWAEGDYTIDVKEKRLNQGDEAIFNLFTAYRDKGMKSMVDLLEVALSGLTAAGDSETMLGIKNFVVQNSSTTSDRFTGGAPSGYTAVSGITISSVPLFKNWAANYTQVSKGDALALMREASLDCDYEQSLMTSDMDAREFDQVYATNKAVWLQFQPLLEAQNERFAQSNEDKFDKELYRWKGQAWFMGRPIICCRSLDGDTKNPLYGFNRQDLFMIAQDSTVIRESEARSMLPLMKATTVDLDFTGNLACVNRRTQFVIATA